MKKQTQLPMFPTGEDLPLFSGTASTAQVDPYKATPPAPKQLSLPIENKVTFGDLDLGQFFEVEAGIFQKIPLDNRLNDLNGIEPSNCMVIKATNPGLPPYAYLLQSTPVKEAK